MLIFMWRVPELVTTPITTTTLLPLHRRINSHIYSNVLLCLGICIVETAAKGTACLREREIVREGREREHWGEGR